MGDVFVVSEIEKKIEGLNAKIQEMQTSVSGLVSDIEQVSGDVSTIKTDQMLYIPQDVTYVTGSKTNTSGSTVLNITGSGTLLFAMYSSGNNVDGNFTITLDGKAFKYSLNGVSSGGGLLCKNEIIGMARDGNGDEYLKIAAGKKIDYTFLYDSAVYITESMLESGATLNIDNYLVSNVPIPFNQSLKVSLSNDEDHYSLSYAIAYILND